MIYILLLSVLVVCVAGLFIKRHYNVGAGNEEELPRPVCLIKRVISGILLLLMIMMGVSFRYNLNVPALIVGGISAMLCVWLIMKSYSLNSKETRGFGLLNLLLIALMIEGTILF